MSTTSSSAFSTRKPLLFGAAAVALLAPMLVPAIAHANPVPDAEAVTYGAGSFEQTVVVPAGVCGVNVTIAGAPGGTAISGGDPEVDDEDPASLRGPNGSGAVIEALLAVGSGEALSVTAGTNGSNVRAAGVPGGGTGSPTGGHPGAGGGGYSSLSLGGDLLLLAGGGGGTGGGHTAEHGSGGDAGTGLSTTESVSGGTVYAGGDGTHGQDLGWNADPATQPGAGLGGSTVGGAAGLNPRSSDAFNWDATAGSSLQGGTGGNENGLDGGAGGGGYFGGGGGASTNGEVGAGGEYFVGGGGGGGSSYVAGSDIISEESVSLFKNRDEEGNTLAGYASFEWIMCDYDLSVAKSVVGTGVFEDGDTVSYEVTVTNEGADAMAIGDTVSIFDDLAVGGTLTSIDGLSTSTPAVGETITDAGIELYDLVGEEGSEVAQGLAVGDSVTITYEVVLSGTEAIENVANITDRGNPDNKSASATVVPAEPSLSLEKSADTESISAAGQKITYSFLVTNTGNIAMSDIAVTEGDFSGTGELAPVVCPDVTLAPEASTTCTTVYTATQADVDAGTITNNAVASGLTPAGNPAVSNDSSAEITAEQNPALELVKTSDSEKIKRAGETVNYVFTLTNTGNVTLSDLEVHEGKFSGTGEMSAIDCPSKPLAPGKAAECTATYKVTQADMKAQQLTNTATASAAAPNGDTVKAAPSTVELPVVQPLAITGANGGLVAGAAAVALLAAGALTLALRRRSEQS